MQSKKVIHMFASQRIACRDLRPCNLMVLETSRRHPKGDGDQVTWGFAGWMDQSSISTLLMTLVSPEAA